MLKKKILGINLYKRLENGESPECLYEGCEGKIKKLREKEERFCEAFYDTITTYICSKNCFHHWKISKSSYSEKILQLNA